MTFCDIPVHRNREISSEHQNLSVIFERFFIVELFPSPIFIAIFRSCTILGVIETQHLFPTSIFVPWTSWTHDFKNATEVECVMNALGFALAHWHNSLWQIWLISVALALLSSPLTSLLRNWINLLFCNALYQRRTPMPIWFHKLQSVLCPLQSICQTAAQHLHSSTY